ncbi:hypothetical protein CDAR_586121 [Caerostris darwini]|uniref:Uncharacterized protein n=1 Tax=Caerostris darwini TaxID=1538125 RepID=A0AAV4UWR0_9ARAC|nr:hypothetical protein CDAR_586121 [Caerostris darwini]
MMLTIPGETGGVDRTRDDEAFPRHSFKGCNLGWRDGHSCKGFVSSFPETLCVLEGWELLASVLLRSQRFADGLLTFIGNFSWLSSGEWDVSD